MWFLQYKLWLFQYNNWDIIKAITNREQAIKTDRPLLRILRLYLSEAYNTLLPIYLTVSEGSTPDGFLHGWLIASRNLSCLFLHACSLVSSWFWFICLYVCPFLSLSHTHAYKYTESFKFNKFYLKYQSRIRDSR